MGAKLADVHRDLTVYNRVDVFHPESLGNILNDFLIDRDVRGVRPATVTFYQNELHQLIKWADAVGAVNLSDLTADALRAYFLNLGQRRNAKGVFQNFGAVRTMMRWAWMEYELPGRCPIDKVKVPSPKNEPKEGVPLADVHKLLDVVQGSNAKRDRAILLLLVDTGIRRTEMTRLNVGDIDGDKINLRPDGTKTGHARSAFMSTSTLKALRAYLAVREEVSSESPLFATMDGDRLTVNGLRQVIRRLCKWAGMDETGLHAFRRTFALETYRATHDIEAVSRLLGHASVTTTRRYLAIDDDDLAAVHRKSSPVDKLLGKRG